MQQKENKPFVTFVLGGPGVGKGTQCELLTKEYSHLVHLSAGELLRREIATGSEDGKIIDSIISVGKIVPVRLSCGLLKKAMEAAGWEKKEFIIDGYPRNQDNVDGWNEIIGDSVIIKQVIFLDCPKDIQKERVMKRSESSGRSDDNLAVFEKRYNTYLNDSYPIIQMYEKEGMVKKIDASKGITEVFEDVKKLFG